jgi:hypothetical protein
MGESLRATVVILLMIGGMAVVVYAGYLYYVALPGEHAPRHVITRAALLVVGFVAALSGAWILR